MSLIGSTSFGFAQNTMHYFQNTVLNSKWHCLRQMPQKHSLSYMSLDWLVTVEGLYSATIQNSNNFILHVLVFQPLPHNLGI